jgi:hypothetical protein
VLVMQWSIIERCAQAASIARKRSLERRLEPCLGLEISRPSALGTITSSVVCY